MYINAENYIVISNKSSLDLHDLQAVRLKFQLTSCTRYTGITVRRAPGGALHLHKHTDLRKAGFDVGPVTAGCALSVLLVCVCVCVFFTGPCHGR